MAVGFVSAAADGLMGLVLNGTTYSAVKGPGYIQCAISPPGPNGTLGGGSNQQRIPTGPFALNGGVATNTADIRWDNLPANETYTQCTLWTAPTGGLFICSGTMSATSPKGGSLDLSPGAVVFNIQTAGASTLGPSAATNADFLGIILNGAADVGPHGPLFIQLHLGNPGAAGTSNPAANTTRQPAGTWTGSGGTWHNAAAIAWTVTAAETYTNMSLWTAATGGTFVGSGTISGGTVTNPSTFTIAIGGATASCPPAS